MSQVGIDNKIMKPKQHLTLSVDNKRVSTDVCVTKSVVRLADKYVYRLTADYIIKNCNISNIKCICASQSSQKSFELHG